ncbi:MAG: ArnT family glycosyltransferase [Flammeovirgaceae bacterium]
MKLDKRFLVIIGLAAVLYTANIWGYSIYILDEAKNATCAWEMYDKGDFIVPTFNDELRTDKPPLHYYFMSVAYALFGSNEFAARFFSAIFGLLTVAITYFASRKLLDKDTAVYAALVLAASLQVAVQFHLAVPDPYLIFFVTATLFCFLLFDQGHGQKWLWLFYVSIALAVLSKGPVAIALPGVIVLAYIFISKTFSWKKIFSILDLRGIALFLAIALPWYIAVHVQSDGEWTYGFFFKHNMQRFTNTMEGHGGFFLMPLIFILSGTLPFSVFAPQAFVHGWKDREQRLLLLALLTVVTFATFFAISRTKLPSYTSPSLPFMAILLGYFLKKVIHRETKFQWHGISFGLFVLIALGFPLGIYFGLPQEKSLAHLNVLWVYFVPMTIIALMTGYFSIQKQWKASFWSMAATFMVGSLTIFYIAFPKVDQLNPVSEGLQHFDHSKKIVAFRGFNPSYAFYIQQPIPRILEVSDLMNEIRNSQEEVILITFQKHWNVLKEAVETDQFELLHEKKNLFEPGNSMVFRIKK